MVPKRTGPCTSFPRLSRLRENDDGLSESSDTLSTVDSAVSTTKGNSCDLRATGGDLGGNSIGHSVGVDNGGSDETGPSCAGSKASKSKSLSEYELVGTTL